jgi:hypothetical protein
MRKLNTRQLHKRFFKELDEIPFIITKNEKPYAVVIPMADYQIASDAITPRTNVVPEQNGASLGGGTPPQDAGIYEHNGKETTLAKLRRVLRFPIT